MKYLLPCILIPVALMAAAQSPVSWTYSITKTKDGVYELHCRAKMEQGWHIYAQKQPDNSIAEPTVFAFSNNPLLDYSIPVQEIGKLQKFKSGTLNIEAYQYCDEVDFVKPLRLKAKAKTIITGTVSYQACTEKKCLAMKTETFSLPFELK